MSEDIIKYIFEKFYQCDSSHSNKGNGLGFALVKQIIVKCNVQITVDSQDAKGTIIYVLLPTIK